jgi:hypothetical protein
MKCIPISDSENFRGSVRAHASDAWPMIEHLANMTGILAGPDGERSRGIFCAPFRFGFRRDFGEFPVVEARTNLAHDFADEAHRRECGHWKAYLDHPQAFFYAKNDRPDAPAEGRASRAAAHACDRCGATCSALFRCLQKRVCFACLNEVMALTDGYRGLKSLMTVEEIPEERPSRGRKRAGTPRCQRCRATGTLIAVRGVEYCKPCATAEVEKLLSL